MKVISGQIQEKIRVECECCGENHYVEFSIPSKRYLDEESFCFVSFKEERFDFLTRLREIKRILKMRKQLSTNNYSYNKILLRKEQVDELYNSLLNEYSSRDLIPSLEEINDTISLVSTVDKSIYIFHKTFSGLLVTLDIDNIKEINTIFDIEIGYSFKETLYSMIKRSFKYLFFPDYNSFIFNSYSIVLSKKEMIEFLKSLSWLSNNIELNEKHNYGVFKDENKIKF